MTPPLTIDRCVCQRTLFADIQPQAAAQRWTLEQLVAATGCGGRCGMCRPYLRRMLADGTTVFHEIISPDEDGE